MRPLRYVANHRTMLGWRSVCEICSNRRVMSTVSKALLMSTATVTIRFAGLASLNPSEMVETIGSNAVTVDLKGRKPCWVAVGRRESVLAGCSRCSKILTARHSKEMGLNEEPRPTGLPGFRTGLTNADFQIDGMSLFWTDKLKSAVR